MCSDDELRLEYNLGFRGGRGGDGGRMGGLGQRRDHMTGAPPTFAVPVCVRCTLLGELRGST